MNIKKSIKIALAKADKRQSWLANKLDMKEASLSSIIHVNKPSSANISRIAGAFDMRVSEFIALGE